MEGLHLMVVMQVEQNLVQLQAQEAAAAKYVSTGYFCSSSRSKIAAYVLLPNSCYKHVDQILSQIYVPEL